MDSVARYLVAKGLFSLIALAGAIYLSGSAAVAGLAMAAVFACVLLFGEARYTVVSARIVWDRKSYRRLALMALPLGLVMMMISLAANMPRYFVESILGTRALGVFAALTYLSIAATTLINAIGLALTPRLARLFASEERASFPLLLLRFSLLAAVPCLAGMGILVLAGKPILAFLYGPLYAADLGVAIRVMAAGAVSCAASVLGYGLTAARCFRQQVPLFLGVTAVAALAASTLIPRYGLNGAAAGLMVAAMAQVVGSVAILYFAMRQGREVRTPVAEMAV
jgi:O-antigen/teichoic acid export membrane protein